jgi:hypothetical protein
MIMGGYSSATVQRIAPLYLCKGLNRDAKSMSKQSTGIATRVRGEMYSAPPDNERNESMQLAIRF